MMKSFPKTWPGGFTGNVCHMPEDETRHRNRSDLMMTITTFVISTTELMST
jgi:hypothetical protein